MYLMSATRCRVSAEQIQRETGVINTSFLRPSSAFPFTFRPPHPNYRLGTPGSDAGGCMSIFSTVDVRSQHSLEGARERSDKATVNLTIQHFEASPAMTVPWAMQLRAISCEEPCHLVQTLTGAILGCGGWVLSRGASDAGTVSMLFEFERQICVDIYTILIAAGLELNQAGHIRLTEFCQCTRNQPADCGAEIASVDLEIQTFPFDDGEQAQAA